MEHGLFSMLFTSYHLVDVAGVVGRLYVPRRCTSSSRAAAGPCSSWVVGSSTLAAAGSSSRSPGSRGVV